MDCGLPGSSVYGILQERILEWISIPFSRESFQPRDRTQVSNIADSLPSEPPGKSTIIIHDPIRGTRFLYIPKVKTVKLLHVRSGKVL